MSCHKSTYYTGDLDYDGRARCPDCGDFLRIAYGRPVPAPEPARTPARRSETKNTHPVKGE